MTRRKFTKSVLAGVGATILSNPAEAAPKYPKGDYVDIHTHLGQVWGNRPELTAEALLHWMDTKSIAQAAVLPLISPESWDHPISTDYVLKHTKQHRDRLIPFCSIDPRTINLGSYKIKRDLLQRYKDAGAKGFGEHKPGVKVDDARNMELFNACAEVGLPVLFHLDNSRNTDKPGLPGLENVLRQIPNGIFIGHAQGWWASISGGVDQAIFQKYPNKQVAPGGAIDRLMDKYPNIYGDLSAGSGANSISRDLDFGREFLIRRQDRLLFGTDYLAPGQEVPQFKLFEETMKLPKKVQKKIFKENARRILGI